MKNDQKVVLIVDDEPGFRALINKKLKLGGFTTLLAQSGEEALVTLWEKKNIDLVLLDIRLPFINGMKVSEIIRKDFPEKKIIVTSALQREEQQFLVCDADDYYYKGEELNSLIEKVNNVFVNKNAVGPSRENEKRNTGRLPVNVLASCESVDHPMSAASAQHFFSYTKDLSVQGARFVVPENVQVGHRFSAALELPAHFLPLLIDCEVIWVKQLVESDVKAKRNNEVGVRFVKLDLAQDEMKLQNYLNVV